MAGHLKVAISQGDSEFRIVTILFSLVMLPQGNFNCWSQLDHGLNNNQKAIFLAPAVFLRLSQCLCETFESGLWQLGKSHSF